MTLKYFIEKNIQFPDAWAVFEPGAFDGKDAEFKGTAGTDETGRYIPTWSRGKDGKGVLESNKDYETKGPGDYYQVPKSRKVESIIDPYPYTLEEQTTNAQQVSKAVENVNELTQSAASAAEQMSSVNGAAFQHGPGPAAPGLAVQHR